MWNDFVSWNESKPKDALVYRGIYTHIAEDVKAGLVLAHIIYWNLPDKNGNNRLRVYRNSEYWLARSRADWWDLFGLTPKEVDGALRKLRAKDLIKTDNFRFNGVRQQHIFLNREILAAEWKKYHDHPPANPYRKQNEESVLAADLEALKTIEKTAPVEAKSDAEKGSLNHQKVDSIQVDKTSLSGSPKGELRDHQKVNSISTESTTLITLSETTEEMCCTSTATATLASLLEEGHTHTSTLDIFPQEDSSIPADNHTQQVTPKPQTTKTEAKSTKKGSATAKKKTGKAKASNGAAAQKQLPPSSGFPPSIEGLKISEEDKRFAALLGALTGTKSASILIDTVGVLKGFGVIPEAVPDLVNQATRTMISWKSDPDPVTCPQLVDYVLKLAAADQPLADPTAVKGLKVEVNPDWQYAALSTANPLKMKLLTMKIALRDAGLDPNIAADCMEVFIDPDYLFFWLEDNNPLPSDFRRNPELMEQIKAHCQQDLATLKQRYQFS